MIVLWRLVQAVLAVAVLYYLLRVPMGWPYPSVEMILANQR